LELETAVRLGDDLPPALVVALITAVPPADGIATKSEPSVRALRKVLLQPVIKGW